MVSKWRALLHMSLLSFSILNEVKRQWDNRKTILSIFNFTMVHNNPNYNITPSLIVISLHAGRRSLMQFLPQSVDERTR